MGQWTNLIKELEHNLEEEVARLARQKEEHRKFMGESLEKVTELEVTLTGLKNEITSNAVKRSEEQQSASKDLGATRNMLEETQHKLIELNVKYEELILKLDENEIERMVRK